MNAVEQIGTLIEAESKIILTNGTVIEGSKDVAIFLLKCAEAYNEGYMDALKKLGLIGLGVGVVTIGAATFYVRRRANLKLKE